MSKKMEKLKLKEFEFQGVLQDIARKKKGSKSCNQPHTAFNILTREITNDEMDELVYGGCHGHVVCLKITVTKEKIE